MKPAVGELLLTIGVLVLVGALILALKTWQPGLINSITSYVTNLFSGWQTPVGG